MQERENSKQKTVGRSAFYDLLVWQKAMTFTKEIYVITKHLPSHEQFGLMSQLQRAAVSIPSNIAEGSKRGKKEFVQFLRIANASAAECETQLLLVRDIYAVDISKTLNILLEVERMLESFIRKIRL